MSLSQHWIQVPPVWSLAGKLWSDVLPSIVLFTDLLATQIPAVVEEGEEALETSPFRVAIIFWHDNGIFICYIIHTGVVHCRNASSLTTAEKAFKWILSRRPSCVVCLLLLLLLMQLTFRLKIGNNVLMFVVVFVKRKTFCVCRGRLKGQHDVIAMRTFHWLLEKFNIGKSIYHQ